MGPLKLFDPSNNTFSTKPLETTRSLRGDSVGQIRFFGNNSESLSENSIEQSLEGILLRLDVRIVGKVCSEIADLCI
jgi:hypothetical protein